MLMNLLLRNYLHYNQYDQVGGQGQAGPHGGGLSSLRSVLQKAAPGVPARPPALLPSPSLLCRGSPGELPSTHLPQAEKFRSKAQKSEVFRSYQQYCRYLFYVGRIRTIQLEYTDAKESLQQVRGRGSGCCGYEGGGAGAGQAATVSP